MTEHSHLATLVAAGWRDEAIADVTNLTPQAVRIIRSSPLFRALVDRTRAELHANTATDPREQFNALLPKAVRVYEDAMDQRDDLTAAVRAADRVTERVLGPSANEQPVLRLQLDSAERALISRVAVEIGSPIEIEASPATNGHGMRSLADAIADAENAA